MYKDFVGEPRPLKVIIRDCFLIEILPVFLLPTDQINYPVPPHSRFIIVFKRETIERNSHPDSLLGRRVSHIRHSLWTWTVQRCLIAWGAYLRTALIMLRAPSHVTLSMWMPSETTLLKSSDISFLPLIVRQTVELVALTLLSWYSTRHPYLWRMFHQSLDWPFRWDGYATWDGFLDSYKSIFSGFVRCSRHALRYSRWCALAPPTAGTKQSDYYWNVGSARVKYRWRSLQEKRVLFCSLPFLTVEKEQQYGHLSQRNFAIKTDVRWN